MARSYRRDARGRFAGGGYSGQTGGRGARLKGGGAKRVGGGARAQSKGVGGTVGKPRGLKPGAIKPKLVTAKSGGASIATTKRPDLSQSAFERRASATEKRAKAAERQAASIDRYNPANRRIVNRANTLRSAADSYASYARRGRTDPDFSARYLFERRGRSTTAPKLTSKEKAAATRRANADKRFRENVRRMEQSRRR